MGNHRHSCKPGAPPSECGLDCRKSNEEHFKHQAHAKRKRQRYHKGGKAGGEQEEEEEPGATNCSRPQNPPSEGHADGQHHGVPVSGPSTTPYPVRNNKLATLMVDGQCCTTPPVAEPGVSLGAGVGAGVGAGCGWGVKLETKPALEAA